MKRPEQDTRQLKKQLAESSRIREQVEVAYQKDLALLTQFISRMSNALRGIDNELDTKLGKIQNAFSQQQSVESVVPVMDEIGLLLKQHGAHLQKELQQTHALSLTAAKRLQKMHYLPSNLRAETRTLLNQMQGPAFSILHYLPFMNQLLNIYQKTLDIKAEPKSTDTFYDAAQASDTQESYEHLREELINLLSYLDFTGSTANNLNNIRQQLLEQTDEKQLAISCVNAIRFIIEGINKERHSAQVFLENLNDVLGNISSCVQKTIRHNTSTQLEQDSLDKQLDASLLSISKSTHGATNLAELALEVRKHVGQLASIINEKKKLSITSNRVLSEQLEAAQQRIKELEDETEQYKEKLTEQKFKSLQDSLTKLPNRVAFEERLELEYNRWQRYHTPLCIAIADIDHFKRINDTYGHIAGDKTLQVISSMLKKSLRGTDFIARFGGEEFVIIFPQTEVHSIFEPLEKARKRIQSIPFKFKNNDITITISIGAAVFLPNDTTASAFERADSALYKAKKSGRNQVIVQHE